MTPRYPIYIPSKGRSDISYTANSLRQDDVPFSIVIEEQEFDEYAERFGEECLLVLPFSNRGSVIPARNWIKYHARETGHKRHWQLDDNMRGFYRRFRGMRIPCHAGIALSMCEEFTDRYENIAISGLNYKMFAPDRQKIKPFYLNVHVYSCTLFLNSLPNEWRGRYNEDTDICLQVLADGWCTVLMNAFLVDKIWTMVLKGGNTDALYHGDGRLRMAKSLERMWPGVVTTKRRFQRPQHYIAHDWKRFDTPLIRRTDIDWDNLPSVNEFGMRLTEQQPAHGEFVEQMLADHREAVQSEVNERKASNGEVSDP